MKKKIIVLIVLVVVLALLIVLPKLFSAPQTNWPALSRESIMNVTVVDSVEGTHFTLRDGSFKENIWEGRGGKGGDIEVSGMLHHEDVAYTTTDLNGDGSLDILGTVRSYAGGTGIFYDLLAFLNKEGKPEYIAQISLGDRIKVNKISAEGNVVTTDIITQGPREGMCCGTMRQVKKYFFDGSKFVEIYRKDYEPAGN